MEKEDARRRTGAEQTTNNFRGTYFREKTSQRAGKPEARSREKRRKKGWAVPGSQNHQKHNQIKRDILFRLSRRANGDPLSHCFGGVATPLIKVELP